MTLSAFALFLAAAAAEPSLDATDTPEFVAADAGNITHGRSLVSPGCQQCCSTGNCYRAFQARCAIRRDSAQLGRNAF